MISFRKKYIKESDSEQHKCERCKWLRGNVTWVGRPPLCDKHRVEIRTPSIR